MGIPIKEIDPFMQCLECGAESYVHSIRVATPQGILDKYRGHTCVDGCGWKIGTP